jgi:hypothetical protein
MKEEMKKGLPRFLHQNEIIRATDGSVVSRKIQHLFFNCCLSVHVDNYTIIIPTKCTRFLLLKSQDIKNCNFVLYFCPYMFQPAWVIFRGLNASAWLKLLLITIY